jgi:hypothetical protein
MASPLGVIRYGARGAQGRSAAPGALLLTVPAGGFAIVRRSAGEIHDNEGRSRSMNIDKCAIINTDINRVLLEMPEVDIAALPTGKPSTS